MSHDDDTVEYQVRVGNEIIPIVAHVGAQASLVADIVAEALETSNVQLMLRGVVLNPNQDLSGSPSDVLEARVLPSSAEDLINQIKDNSVNERLRQLGEHMLEDDSGMWKNTTVFRQILHSVIALERCQSHTNGVPIASLLEQAARTASTESMSSALVLDHIHEQVSDALAVFVIQVADRSKPIYIDNLNVASKAAAVRERVAVTLGPVHPLRVRLIADSDLEVDYSKPLPDNVRRSLRAELLPEDKWQIDADLAAFIDELRCKPLHPKDTSRTWGSTSAFAEIFRCVISLLNYGLEMRSRGRDPIQERVPEQFLAVAGVSTFDRLFQGGKSSSANGYGRATGMA